MMFKKTLISSLVLLILVALYICYYCFYLLPKDIKRYEDYVESVQNHEAYHKEEPTHQYRTDVQKDIWHLDAGSRLHYQIRAASSVLTLTPSQSAFSLQEHLHKIDCVLQEKLYHDAFHQPMQQLNTFYADEGIYDFTNHLFSAHTVFLKFYTLSGATIPLIYSEAPFLQGRARSVTLALSSRGPVFHADKFIAHMDLREYER